ncbi:MAG: NAD(P)H-dependent oxidoreductase subunit E [Candidatus Sumerlaeota bacterium]|nr:NAD(P)H-dependent oxidoreductase subunit E [Candidatus Sumerlaeota bacterium]
MKSIARTKKKSSFPTQTDRCAPEKVNANDILPILAKQDREQGGLIAILEGIQTKYGYLPEEALRILSDQTGRSLVDIYGVATFYRSFTLHPRGKHLVTACLGTACHVRSAPRIVEELQQQLGIKTGETTPDKQFTLETVNCLGACALGPVVVMDGHYFSKVRKSQIKQLLDKTIEGLDRIELGKDKRIFPIEVSCAHCERTLMDPAVAIDGYPSVKVAISVGPKRGWLRLSALYGSYNVSTEYDISMNTVVDFYCPHCEMELTDSCECLVCGAAMVSLAVRGGGVLQICSRRGCKGHMLDLG